MTRDYTPLPPITNNQISQFFQYDSAGYDLENAPKPHPELRQKSGKIKELQRIS
jgi:hypothetical protein